MAIYSCHIFTTQQCEVCPRGRHNARISLIPFPHIPVEVVEDLCEHSHKSPKSIQAIKNTLSNEAYKRYNCNMDLAYSTTCGCNSGGRDRRLLSSGGTKDWSFNRNCPSGQGGDDEK